MRGLSCKKLLKVRESNFLMKTGVGSAFDFESRAGRSSPIIRAEAPEKIASLEASIKIENPHLLRQQLSSPRSGRDA